MITGSVDPSGKFINQFGTKNLLHFQQQKNQKYQKKKKKMFWRTTRFHYFEIHFV